MDASVVICSYNRAHNLPECFDALLAMEGTEGIAWEVRLVDNNSTDATRAVTDEYMPRFAAAGRGDTASPELHYHFEPHQGLSHARNRGIAEARGTYVAFIDDDIRVGPRWLRSLVDTFTGHDCDAVGGRIHVESPQRIPDWITPDMYGFLGHQDFGEEPCALDGEERFPFGGNMAMHRRVFERIGVFDPDLGRKGEGRRDEELFKGEETDFFHRLAQAGGVIRYHPDALVYHKILPHQLEKRFFLTLHRNAGILQARRDRHGYSRTLVNVPMFLFPQLVRAIARYYLALLRGGPSGAFRKRMNVAYFLGMISAFHARRGS